MIKRKLIIRGVTVGIIIFIIVELFAFCYAHLMMKLVPNYAAWTPMRGFLINSLSVVYWVCHPLSKIYFSIFGKSPIKIPIVSFLLFRVVDLAFWIVLSVVILYKKIKTS